MVAKVDFEVGDVEVAIKDVEVYVKGCYSMVYV